MRGTPLGENTFWTIPSSVESISEASARDCQVNVQMAKTSLLVAKQTVTEEEK